MSKKWYNYIVSVDDAGGAEEGRSNVPNAPGAAKSASQSVAEIAFSIAAEPKFTTPISDPTSFDEIYKAAEIPTPPQGYSILKISQMLESEHIRNLPSDVKRSSVLVGLDAAGETARWTLMSGCSSAQPKNWKRAKIKRTATFRRRSINTSPGSEQRFRAITKRLRGRSNVLPAGG
jgi:hypothetical protein